MTLKIIKLFVNRSLEPKFFVFNRFDENKKRILVTFPVYKPDRFREAKWFDLSEIRIEWIKEFLE